MKKKIIIKNIIDKMRMDFSSVSWIASLVRETTRTFFLPLLTNFGNVGSFHGLWTARDSNFLSL